MVFWRPPAVTYPEQGHGGRFWTPFFCPQGTVRKGLFRLAVAYLANTLKFTESEIQAMARVSDIANFV